MKLPHITLLMILAPTLAFGQTPNAETEKAIMKLEQDLSEALLNVDATAVAQLVADGFFIVTPDGKTQDKAAFLADVKSRALKLESNKLDEMKVHAASADMAVVTYRSTDKGSHHGKDISGQYRWTDVVVKRDGRWQVIVGQGTAIAEAKP